MLADDNFIFDENGRKFSKQVENTVGKGENTRYVFKRLVLQTRKTRACLGKGLQGHTFLAFCLAVTFPLTLGCKKLGNNISIFKPSTRQDGTLHPTTRRLNYLLLEGLLKTLLETEKC